MLRWSGLADVIARGNSTLRPWDARGGHQGDAVRVIPVSTLRGLVLVPS